MIKLFNNNYTYFNSHNFIVATLGAPFHTNATLNANVNSFVEEERINSFEPSRHKIKFIEIYLSPEDFFNFDIFKTKFNSLDFSARYSLLFRVCYGDNPYYKMLGRQIGLSFTNYTNNMLYLEYLHTNLKARLDVSMLNYNYGGDEIIAIQIIAYKVIYTDTVNKAFLNLFNSDDLGDKKSLVNIPSYKMEIVDKYVLPLTMNLNAYGTNINTIIDEDNNYIGYISIDGIESNFVDLINEKSMKPPIKIPKDTYIFLSKNKKYVTLVYSDVTLDNKRRNIISVYTIDGGLVFDAIDTALTVNTFSRTIGNVEKIIDTKNKSVETSIKIELSIIKPKNSYDNKKKDLMIADPFIGSLDLETFNYDGLSRVYALGFYTKRHGVKTFYIDELTLNSNDLILKCFDELITHKYAGYTFYVHNLGKYDIYFLLNVLIKSGKYKIEIVSRDELILSISIKDMGYTIKLVDSYNILSKKLETLCLDFSTEVTKGIFPYKFMDKNTLFYKGPKPDISFYNENVDKQLYNKIPSLDWDAKSITLDYLEKDLLSLYQVIAKFSEYIYINHRIQLTGSITISSLAIKLFLKKFYSNNIPLINRKNIYYDIKKSYFGGITEVYKPYGENLFYYDVNSLYPFASLNPMPGNKCVYVNSINLPLEDVNNLFGFYYCHIKTNSQYLGLLPYRTDKGIIMPNGEWEGWYFSEELKFAANNGYNINIIKGYNFNQEYNVFNDYVKYFYDIKSTTRNATEKAISKSLLNNLLGRFGLDIDKSRTDIFTENKFNEISQTKEILGFNFIGDKILVNFKNKTNKDICDEFNVDFKNSVLKSLKNKDETEKTFSDVSIAVASATTSYARIYMNKIKLSILNKGGNIYYSDTDSLVTDIPLDTGLVNKELGSFKLEHKIDRGYFISSKTYCLILNREFLSFINGDNNLSEFDLINVKAKGVNSKLSEEDFINLYEGLEVKASRTESVKSYEDGYVNIDSQQLTLSGNAYTKRSKIYDNNNNKWIDTKPLNYTIQEASFLGISNLKGLSLYLTYLLLIGLAFINFWVGLDDINSEEIFEAFENKTIDEDIFNDYYKSYDDVDDEYIYSPNNSFSLLGNFEEYLKNNGYYPNKTKPCQGITNTGNNNSIFSYFIDYFSDKQYYPSKFQSYNFVNPNYYTYNSEIINGLNNLNKSNIFNNLVEFSVSDSDSISESDSRIDNIIEAVANISKLQQEGLLNMFISAEDTLINDLMEIREECLYMINRYETLNSVSEIIRYDLEHPDHPNNSLCIEREQNIINKLNHIIFVQNSHITRFTSYKNEILSEID